MKIRTGFVSNSSTSSFICDVCHEVVAERDLCITDAEMYQCTNGHTFCEIHALEATPEDVAADIVRHAEIKLKEYPSKWWEEALESAKQLQEKEDLCMEDIEEYLEEDEGRYAWPSCFCPICNLEDLRDSDVKDYLLKKAGMTKEELVSSVKAEFNNINNLMAYLKGGESEG